MLLPVGQSVTDRNGTVTKVLLISAAVSAVPIFQKPEGLGRHVC